MPTDPATWSEYLRRTLQCYDEPLLRQVVGRLCRPRNQWPAAELIERSLNTLQNPAVLDRRIGDLSPAGRQLLALIGHSRQPRWPVGNLVEMLVTLGQPDGLQPILEVLQAGLLYPELVAWEETGEAPPATRIKTFEQWLAQAEGSRLVVFAHPLVTARVPADHLGLPACPAATLASGRGTALTVHEADGLEWPLRLAVLWQQVAAIPLRRTQHGGFFKRDLERLQGDPLLNAAAPDSLSPLPDLGLLAVELALSEGLLRAVDGELRSDAFPRCWQDGLPATIASLWASLMRLGTWNPEHGWRAAAALGNPYPSAYLLTLLLLSRLPAENWASPTALAEWMLQRHPYWQGAARSEAQTCGVAAFLLGLAYQLRLVQAVKQGKEEWLVRLSPLGRWLLRLGETPTFPAFPQTLLVQPNLEILVYRQGLTPDLVARLGRFAAWHGLGSACTLQLQPESVYRALELGDTFETILQTLQRHGMKPTPDAVVNSLRTWADKRDRIQIYAAAALFEFNSAEDLNDALARGLPAVRLSERLAVVARDSDIDYRHFRLTATRDYTLPPERCVEVEADGVTLSVDLARSDLLIETEVRRFAEPIERAGSNGRRSYRLTPASLAVGRNHGMSPQTLEAWFVQRSGHPLSAAARLLLLGPQVPPLALRRLQVLSVPTAEIADGLQQWPGTRALIEGRLGPTSLIVAEEHIAALRERLDTLGVRVEGE